MNEWSTRLKQILERHHFVIFGAIIVVAILLRFCGLTTIPGGVNQDEANAGYEAYSLIEHGTDKWGNKWPAYFISWGSGQNALLSYLEIPVIKLLGLNVFSIRLIPATLGVLSVVLTYLLLRRNKTLALLVSFLLAIFPWAILASRWGLESSILSFFILLGIYTFSAGLRHKWLMPFSLIPFGLALYAYFIAMVIIPVLLLGIFIIYHKELWKRLLPFSLSLILLAITCVPIGIFIAINFVLHRVPAVVSHLPFSVPLLLQSRLDQVQMEAPDGLLWSNIHFFTSGFTGGEPWFTMPGYMAAFYLPAAFIGCTIVLRGSQKIYKVFGLWFISSLMVAFIAPLNLTRANSFLIPIVVLSAVAFIEIGRNLKDKQLKQTVTIVTAALIIGYCCVALTDYFTHYNKQHGYSGFNTGFEKALTEANRSKGNIYVSQYMNLNYVYTLFYLETDSQDFQKNVDYVSAEYYGRQIYKVERYRNYYFYPTNPALSKTYTYILKDADVLNCKHMITTYNAEGWRVGTCEM